MGKSARPTRAPTAGAPTRVRRVQGLRASGAAGPHGHRPTRAEQLAAALAEYGPGSAECPECGHSFERDETPDPAQETCRPCWEFLAWFQGDGEGDPA